VVFLNDLNYHLVLSYICFWVMWIAIYEGYCCYDPLSTKVIISLCMPFLRKIIFHIILSWNNLFPIHTYRAQDFSHLKVDLVTSSSSLPSLVPLPPFIVVFNSSYVKPSSFKEVGKHQCWCDAIYDNWISSSAFQSDLFLLLPQLQYTWLSIGL